MIIKDAYIRNFGKIHNRQFTFSEGLNVIYGPNEAGKTTLQMFLKAMLFGLEKTRVRSRLDEYQKYEPWEVPADFSGSLHFETGGQLFYLERSFYQKDRRDILRNERDGEELSVAQGDLEMLLGNVSRRTYENTFCIGQNAVAIDSAAGKVITDDPGMEERNVPDGFRVSDADTYFENERKKRKKQLRELENERRSLQKIREEKEEMLRNDLETLRKQVTEKEILQKQLEERETLRKQSEEKEHFRKPQADRDTLRRQQVGEEELRGQKTGNNFSKEPSGNPVREAQRINGADQENEIPHRKKWNVLMTLGVLLFLIFGLLGRSGRIPGVAGAAVCILAGILVVIGAAQEFRKQRETGYSENETLKRTAVDEEKMPEKMPESDPEWQLRQDHLQEKMTRLQAELDILKGQEQEKKTELFNYQEEREAEQENSRKIQKLQSDLSALSLAQETLQDLLHKRSERQIRMLEENVSSILEEITGEPQEKAGLDGNMQPVLQKAGKYRTPQAMSRGTADQIYFAWRMAVGEYAASEEALPFLLDEPFAYYDEERLENTLRWLSGRKEQILLFTCSRRETDCLDRIGAVYRKLEMS